jgi:hypothetical protein
MTTIGPKQPDSSSSATPPRDEPGFAAEGRPELPKGSARLADKDMGVAQTRADTGIQIKKKDKIITQADTMTRVAKEDVKRQIIAGESTRAADVPAIPAPKVAAAGEGSNADAVRSWYKDSSIAQISNAMAPILDTYKESKKMAGQAAIEQGKQIQEMQTKEMPARTRAAANKEAMMKFTEGMSNFMSAASSVFTAVATTSNIGEATREIDAQINAKGDEVYHLANPGAGGAAGGVDPAAVGAPPVPPRDNTVAGQTNEDLAREVPGEAANLANAREGFRKLMDSRSTLVSNKLSSLNQITSAQGQALSSAINGVSSVLQGVIKGDIGIIEAEKQVIEGYRNAAETFKQNSSKVESEQADAIKGLFDFMSRFVDQTGRSIQSRA